MGQGTEQILQTIFQPYKGILAADERPSSMDRRLKLHGIESGETMRDTYRALLFSTPNLERTISGVILSEDTFSQHTTGGTLTREYLADLGIVVGVKVDEGLAPYDRDSALSVTKGLENLKEKCAAYRAQGAGFLKWRSVIPVSGADDDFLNTVSSAMAQYATTAIRHDLVPIVEPEVLLSGDHSADATAETLERTITAMLRALRKNRCSPRQCILKTSFVANGLNREPLSADLAAEKTLAVFKKTHLDRQKGFYGIVFLSGGLDSRTAIAYIQRTRAVQEDQNRGFLLTVPLTFSYGRALQEPALREWRGREEKSIAAQIIFTQTLQHAVKKYKGSEDITLITRNPQ